MSLLFKLTLLFTCSIFSFVGLAQNDIMQHHESDVIYFNGGSVFFGKIVNIENDLVEFKMTDGEVFYFHMNKIKKVIQKFDKEGVKKLNSLKKKLNEFKEKGIYNTTYINFPQGNKTQRYFNEWNYNYWVIGMGIHHVIGMQHNRWFGTGIGVGFDGYELGYGKNVLSIYGECRGYMLAERFSPYYSVGLGYGISITNKHADIVDSKGGLFFNPSLGCRFGGTANANFVMSLGYKLQVATFTETFLNSGSTPTFETTYTNTYNFNRLNITFGVLF